MKTMIMVKVIRSVKNRTKEKEIHLEKKRTKEKEIHSGMMMKRKKERRLLETPSVLLKMRKKVMTKVLGILSATMMMKIRTRVQETLLEILTTMQTEIRAVKNLSKSPSPLVQNQPDCQNPLKLLTEFSTR